MQRNRHIPHIPSIRSSGSSGANSTKRPPNPHPTSATVMGFVSGRGAGRGQWFGLGFRFELRLFSFFASSPSSSLPAAAM